MDISVQRAKQIFFPKPTLQLVFFEAIANAIDAGASKIEIKIFFQSLQNSKSIKIEIIDNGEGFTKERVNRFKTLLNVENDEHKGVGRLVYLQYFKNVLIESCFDNKKINFVYNDNFKGDEIVEIEYKNSKNKTILCFVDYFKEKVYSYENLSPEILKESIKKQFFPTFYEKKNKNQTLDIDISLTIEEPSENDKIFNGVDKIGTADLENLSEIEFDRNEPKIFDDLKILYQIERTNERKSIITIVSSDNRSIDINLLNEREIPIGYKIIFVLYSKEFIGKSDSQREKLIFDDDFKEDEILPKLKYYLKNIINEKIPEVRDLNNKTTESLKEKYPHLNGYFNFESIGLINRNDVLTNAQNKFFNDQKEILEASELTDEQFEKSKIISARLLMEYVLYRAIIINKLSKIKNNDSEKKIHNLIVPMGKRYVGDDTLDHIYKVNAWVLDERFMTYRSILSDQKMKHLLKEIEIDEDEKGEPDLSIVFSSTIETSEKVDVVIAELKKLDLKLSKIEEVISQLRQRARNLVDYYETKIQRIWYYGVIDFTDEFVKSLEEDLYIPLYSSGNIYYKEYPIKNKAGKSVSTALFLLDYKALIEDAKSRNKTFLDILKSGFSEK